MPAEETVSMQLFSQRPHLVVSAAKQEVEVSSAYWYGRGVKARIIVGESVKRREKEKEKSGINVVIKCGKAHTIKDSVFHRCFHLFWIMRTLLRLTVGMAMPGITPCTNKNHKGVLCPTLASAVKLTAKWGGC